MLNVWSLKTKDLLQKFTSKKASINNVNFKLIKAGKAVPIIHNVANVPLDDRKVQE